MTLPPTPAADELARCLDYWREGYEMGFAAGQRIGFAQGENAEAQLWSEALGVLRTAASGPTQAEIERRRAEPFDVAAWHAEYRERDRRHQAEVLRRAGVTGARRGAA